MARFVGSDPVTNNWGEDFVVQKCIEYFDDSCIVYRNREVFGAQFDVCVLVPNQGIIIFEVKTWKPDTILRVDNGDTVYIRVRDNATGMTKEEPQRPMKQARGYVFSLLTRIRQRIGKVPYIIPMVCLPLTEEVVYNGKRLDTVCEPETTLLKEDFRDKAAFYRKINLALLNGQRNAAKRSSEFNEELVFQVRQIFESDLELKEPSIAPISNSTKSSESRRNPYSLFYHLPKDYHVGDSFVSSIVRAYSCGTKLNIVVSNCAQLAPLATAIDQMLKSKGVVRTGFADLKLGLEDMAAHMPPLKAGAKTYRTFNCLVTVSEKPHEDIPYLCIENGVIEKSEVVNWLDILGQDSDFNFEQYRIEHSEPQKNIVIKAGAGTGKTFTMISRIGFLCHTQSCNVYDMASRIVMITFTNDAADQMKRKIKEYFNNYYLLTEKVDYLRIISVVDNMQISTIHSYAKKIISMLGQEFGYGVDVRITSGEFARRQIIADVVNEYLVQKQRTVNQNYVTKIGQPIYGICENITEFIARLHNQNIDVASLSPENFGTVDNLADAELFTNLHALYANLVPEAEKKYNEKLLKNNQMHLSTMMSLLHKCLDVEENVQRLKFLQTGKPQFMFIDEFQDTDDVQIDALKKIAELLEYKLFVVGDIKQCIYRFRGAEEKAFDRLQIDENRSEWVSYPLSKNFRTDKVLLDLFDRSFSEWGKPQGNAERVLIYNAEDRLIGTKSMNEGVALGTFYRAVPFTRETDRMKILFEEVRRQQKRIAEADARAKAKGRKLSADEKTIAILVRENWQAELIRKEGKAQNFTVITNTGGDLYSSAPALDLMALVNALVHYDEADYLYAFVQSNFIGGGVSKSRMFALRNTQPDWRNPRAKVDDTAHARELQQLIDTTLGRSNLRWNELVASLRVTPVMQVLRTIYSALKPWIVFDSSADKSDSWRQDYYRQNMDLLFEQIVSSCNTSVLTINTLADVLLANIRSCKNVDSRFPDVNDESEDTPILIKSITIHKAKGLEYGAVILPFCSAAINKIKSSELHVQATSKGENVQIGYRLITKDNEMFQNSFFDKNLEISEREREEMRILYVAMTRAIQSFSWLKLEGSSTANWQKMIWEGD